MPLSDTAIRRAKPKGKSYKISDGDGMYLFVTPAGGRLWRLDYRFAGKRKTLTLGSYPEISLLVARERRLAARRLLAQGVDPMSARRAERAVLKEEARHTVASVSAEWFTAWSEGKARVTIRHARQRLDNFILPTIGDMPVAAIRAPDVLAALRPIEARGLLDTCHRVKMNISQIIEYAIARGLRDMANPCLTLNQVIKANTVKHYASLTTPEQVAELLRAIDGYRGQSVFVRAALRLLPLFFCRPGELIAMRWADVNLNRGEWSYVATKTKSDHLVPLSSQAIKILQELSRYREAGAEVVFPSRSRRCRHMSNMSINRALQTMGYDTKTEITGHGFRAMARTMLAERLGFPPEVIEHQLAHRVPDALGLTYNRTKYIERRREMMQSWADYLDGLKAGQAG
ncbi:MAG: tyrosine-type recombinase/integrase [Desulfobulbaceae bacterium]|jgi:integrase|nr:tyrosine-type recombinase/integrase [Desulfobulbaceae bacterium]